MEYLLPPCVGLPGGSRTASRNIFIWGKRFSLFPNFATGKQNVDAVEFWWTAHSFHRYPLSIPIFRRWAKQGLANEAAIDVHSFPARKTKGESHETKI